MITYTYHIHDGNSTNGGACYEAVYHTHVGSNGTGCYTKRVPSTYGCGGEHSIYVEDVNMWRCTTCGCVGGKGKCKHDDYKWVLDCGYGDGQLIKYVLCCGKTETTIESAVIIFNN